MEATELVGQNAWLTDSEKTLATDLAKEFAGAFEARDIDQTIFLAIRTEDVILSYLGARRLEACLNNGEKEAASENASAPGNNTGKSDSSTKSSAPAKPDKPRAVDPFFEAAGKARDRWRKTLKELEDYCNRVGTPAGQGVAEMLKPVFKKADGVLADALAFETRKQAKA